VDSLADVAGLFETHFSRGPVTVTSSGRRALSLVLGSLGLEQADEVCVYTTFGFPHVSSCVTSTVFNYCKPSRLLTTGTKAVIVIHELGVPFPAMSALVQKCADLQIPLIEDCAHTVDSFTAEGCVGSFGDWVICSLPKLFPCSAGGVLVGPLRRHQPSSTEARAIDEARRAIVGVEDTVPEWSAHRRDVFVSLAARAECLGLQPAYRLTDGITPWSFPLHVPDPDLFADIAAAHEIETGRWYGTDIVVFPCHQYMSAGHVSLIANTLQEAIDGAD
jgi:dTDP-4-amino-4,6-dideoxygalactose transaminase